MKSNIIFALRAMYRGRVWYGDRWRAARRAIRTLEIGFSKRAELSKVYISPEALEDIRKWGAGDD